MRTQLAAGGERTRPAGPPPHARNAPPGRWTTAGPLPFPMVILHGQQEGPVLLPDGRVLFAGGADASLRALDGAALFRPADGRWTVTGPFHHARRMHTLTPLADGRVLAAGGINGPQAYPQQALATAEVYDPATGTWSPTGALGEPRHSHTATRLPDGRVLVAGGERPRDARTQRTLATAELYDPATGTWTPARDMGDARWHHTAVALTDGRVLVAGGLTSTGRSRVRALGLCEIYDPATGAWTPTGALHDARCAHQSVLLADGTVLTTGGSGPRGGDDARHDTTSMAGVERYDPAAEEWRREPPLPWGRGHHRALLLGTGEVLVCGGVDFACQDIGHAAVLRYDPGARTWSFAAPMRTGRWAFGAVSLADGRVLAVAGFSRSGVAAPRLGVHLPAAEVEVFTP
ncbi:Kelch repeat-containing protein [Streptomyces sp. NPDC053493]|uniref:Kelch repeat-containing protein n=1 Tax=Streptomyces sp. NPDC053493 TaxID=3365705 RepID=UPI0037D60EFC